MKNIVALFLLLLLVVPLVSCRNTVPSGVVTDTEMPSETADILKTASLAERSRDRIRPSLLQVIPTAEPL